MTLEPTQQRRLSFQDWMSLVQAIAVVAAVGLALRGLESWRDQVRGQGAFEAARSGLRSAQRVASEVRSFLASAPLNATLLRSNTKYRDDCLGQFIDQLKSIDAEMEASAFEIRAVIGIDVTESFRALGRLGPTAHMAALRVYHEGEKGWESWAPTHEDRKIVGDNNAVYLDEVGRALARIENLLAPHLRR
jgi:hypothetical protein